MRVKEIMTDNLITIGPNTIVTKVCDLFDKESFHHLPVVDDDQVCIGIISKSDYYQIQDQMTKINREKAKANNQLLWRSLIAEDIMSSPIVTLDLEESIDRAKAIFLENKIHSIVITEHGKCKGIITTFDVIKNLN